MTAYLAVHGGVPVRTRPLPTALTPAGRTIGAEEREAVARVLAGGVLTSTFGSETPALEEEMAERHGRRAAVACSSGTASLHLALAAVAPDPGDEVVTTPISDFGTVAPILAQNAVPVFADVDPASGNLDPAAVEAAITPRTKAIVVVHLFGAPARLTELAAIARAHGLLLVEDCAQAWLATDPDGRLVGTRGDVACFSLQQFKHITCGDGGLALTDDPALARRMRLFADKGWDRSGGRRHLMHGLNYRMTELQAAVARAQLAKLTGVVETRRKNAAQLLGRLGDLAGLVPDASEGHAWWLLPLSLDRGRYPAPRANAVFAEALTAEGVPAAAGYLEVPLYLNPALTTEPVYGRSRAPLPEPSAYAEGLCPVAEDLVDRGLVTVAWNEGYTDADVEDVAGAIGKVHECLGA